MFPSRYLKAEDLPGTVILTIKNVAWETMHDQDGAEVEKPVVYFDENPKALVLNKTNADTLSHLYGNESDNWNGERVTLMTVKVSAFGKVVDGLRFDNKTPSPPAAPATDEEIIHSLGDPEVPA
jgi:hypothetical protein